MVLFVVRKTFNFRHMPENLHAWPITAGMIQSLSVHEPYRSQPICIDWVITDDRINTYELYRYIWKYNFTLDFHTIKHKT